MRQHIFFFFSALRAADHLPSGCPAQPLLQRAGRQRLLRLQEPGGHSHGAHLAQLHSKLKQPCGRQTWTYLLILVAKEYQKYQKSIDTSVLTILLYMEFALLTVFTIHAGANSAVCLSKWSVGLGY